MLEITSGSMRSVFVITGIIVVSVCEMWESACSCFLIDVVGSKSAMIIAADEIAFCALSTPIVSMGSVVVRSPAVSMSLKRVPLMLIRLWIVSRVVPSMSETIARSSWLSALSKVDFPALGIPAITVGIPSLITFPAEYESARLLILASASSARFRRLLLSANSTSSSEKSSSSSISEANFMRSERRFSIDFEYAPRVCESASLWAASDRDAIRSAIPSACARSIFPFRKAIWENSPGSAGEAPC